MQSHYGSRSAGRSTRRMGYVELFLCALVLAVLIAAIVLFLFVYHDAPLRAA
jgi:cell division protein FtsN